jgi:hypothetical protein
MTSGKDKPLPQAPVVRRAGGQAVERAEGSRHPSCRGARRPPSTPGARTARPVEMHVAHRASGRRRDTPIIIYRTSRTTRREEEKWDPSDLSLSLSYPTPSLWHMKEKGRTPMEGGQKNSQHFTTRDLGAYSLSHPFLTPTADQRKNTSSSNENQYKPLCLPCTPSGPDAQTQIH